jgi:hypothetical protein
MEEQQLAYAYGVTLMLDILSLGTLSLATKPVEVVESVATREAVAAGEAAVDTAARTVRTAGRRGDAFRRFFYDARKYDTIRREYWRSNGPANGRSLHHWLIPQRATWIPEGIRNAGWNRIELPALKGVFHPKLGLNTWMGWAPQWNRFGPWIAAHAVENGLRVAIPSAGAGAAYSGYKVGDRINEILWKDKK